MTSIVLKFSGVVSYSDGSSGPFESSIHREIVSSPFTESGQQEFAQLSDVSSDVTEFFSLLPGTVSAAFATPDADKTVTDLSMVLTGSIARDDQTSEGFAIEYYNGNVDHFPSSTSTVWAELVADSDFLSQITSVLEDVVGSGNMTITA